MHWLAAVAVLWLLGVYLRHRVRYHYRLGRGRRYAMSRRRRGRYTSPLSNGGRRGSIQDGAGQGPRCAPPAMREYVFRRDGYRCTNCGSREQLEADHLIPYSLGGRTVPSNLTTRCHTCNHLKSNTFMG